MTELLLYYIYKMNLSKSYSLTDRILYYFTHSVVLTPSRPLVNVYTRNDTK